MRISSGTHNYAKLFVEVTWGAYDIESNSTTVTWKAGINNNGGKWYSNSIKFYGVNINGTQVWAGGTFSNITTNGDHVFKTGTLKITHNADGTKKDVPVSFSGWLYSNYNTGTVSGKFTLPTIPRATACPSFSVDVEKSINIGLNPASTSFTHAIKLQFGSNTSYLNATGGLSSTLVKLSTKSPIFNCPSSYYSQFTGSSKTGTITLYTYSGTTLIGSKTNTFTIYANATLCKPYLVATMVDNNATTKALTGNANNIVKGQSNGLVSITTKRASSSNDSKATITALYVNNISIDASATSYTINKVSSLSFTLKAVNSRGFTGEYTYKASGTLINYINLSVSANFFRPLPTTGEVNVNLTGNYFNGNFGTTNNTLSLSINYREKGTSDWLPLEINNPTISGNTYSLEQELGSIFDYQKQYEFQVIVKDKLTTISNVSNVPQGIPIFWWDKDKVTFEKNIFLQKKDITELLRLKVSAKTIPASERIGSEGGTYLFDSTPFKRIMFVEPLFSLDGSDISGGSLLCYGIGFSYIYTGGLTASTIYTGVYVRALKYSNTQGQIIVSAYKHSGCELSGYRVYYYDV